MFVVTVLVLGTCTSPIGDQPIRFPPAPAVDMQDIIRVLPVDAIEALDSPPFVSVEAASQFMRSEDRLVGIQINGDSRAYPINVLSSHEIVNDVVGGEPIMVTWCPLCYTAIVFSRTVDDFDAPLTFGVSGKLLHNTLIMYDRESESYWSQLYGAAIEGPRAGVTLSYFPSVHTDWETWRADHTESLVLDVERICGEFRCSLDPYASYYLSAEEGIVNSQIPREAAASGPKDRVLGVIVAGSPKAYPFESLADRHVINDEIGGVPILIWFDSESETGAGFLREVDAQILHFEPVSSVPGAVTDLETGSLWKGATGVAISGPMEGTRLGSILSTTAFEFGWYAYYPHSTTFEQ